MPTGPAGREASPCPAACAPSQGGPCCGTHGRGRLGWDRLLHPTRPERHEAQVWPGSLPAWRKGAVGKRGVSSAPPRRERPRMPLREPTVGLLLLSHITSAASFSQGGLGGGGVRGSSWPRDPQCSTAGSREASTAPGPRSLRAAVPHRGQGCFGRDRSQLHLQAESHPAGAQRRAGGGGVPTAQLSLLQPHGGPHGSQPTPGCSRRSR